MKDSTKFDCDEITLILGGMMHLLGLVDYDRILIRMTLCNDMIIMWLEQLKVIKLTGDHT